MKLGTVVLSILFQILICYGQPGFGLTPGGSITDLDVNRRVSRSSKVTYLQLMRKVFPKATADWSILNAETMLDIRQMDSGDMKKAYAGPLELSFISGFKNAGDSRATLLFWLRSNKEAPAKGTEFTPDGLRVLRDSTMVMMLFKTSGEPALLDAVETEQSDNQTDLKASNLSGYFWKISYHANCEKYIKTYQLVSSEKDRLAVVFKGMPVIYDDGDCGRKVKQEPYLAMVGGQRSTVYLNVVSQVNEYMHPCDGRIRHSYTTYFQYKLRREPDGKLTALISPNPALHREMVKLELEMAPEP